MTAKYGLEEGMTALREQIPDVMNAFGAVLDRVTRHGLLTAKTKRWTWIFMDIACLACSESEGCTNSKITNT